jgi:hypothetical protein
MTHFPQPDYSPSLYLAWGRSNPVGIFVDCAPATVLSVTLYRGKTKPSCCDEYARDPTNRVAEICCSEWMDDPTVQVATLKPDDSSLYAWPPDVPPGDYVLEVHVNVTEITSENPQGFVYIWDPTWGFYIHLVSAKAG